MRLPVIWLLENGNNTFEDYALIPVTLSSDCRADLLVCCSHQSAIWQETDRRGSIVDRDWSAKMNSVKNLEK